ncbi:MAG: hypothetical protein HC881_08780 [Leptolyngbyaceae cyanobacterium SL_7_1]|nr:hypothetical protein [Leptolyngbyaceae cyanobacterium SL_7_1]
MYDNKIRLSQDVIEKAELIANEWGLKNARAAVEAVFRRYADDYLTGRTGEDVYPMMRLVPSHHEGLPVRSNPAPKRVCEAMDALEDLLGA